MFKIALVTFADLISFTVESLTNVMAFVCSRRSWDVASCRVDPIIVENGWKSASSMMSVVSDKSVAWRFTLDACGVTLEFFRALHQSKSHYRCNRKYIPGGDPIRRDKIA